MFSWTKSLDAMPPTGRDERMPSLRTSGHDVNERTTKILSCASPTDLNAANEKSYPTSPLECAALDSLRFLGISLMPCPLLAVRRIDYRDSSDHIPACSTLRNRGLGDWRGERAGLLNAHLFDTKDYLPLVPATRMEPTNDMRVRPVVHSSSSRSQVAKVFAPARPRADIAGIVRKTVNSLLGTEVPDDAPLMGAGLDSIAAVDLV